ncbi:GMP synthase (glutamine-hydrolysing) [Halorubrum aquaticum]|uniref:GMP synthase (Glutamine-hydrolysing) n=1 Tax=Halorubrum aquaticum TaxID=387340 RepID=A0A1I3BEH7_9EURY|nr:type 1 glutamine amidotransferase [Halorubrum aquaticum]SFH60111.1 GMP synthase (glutamine-hydrolysing) [Halorubrum aquaticum]
MTADADPHADEPTLYVVRNEPDPESEYHCDALASWFPEATEVDFVAGERVPVDEADGVVLTGSTAGVYEVDEHPWIAEEEALVRELVDREIPTLGVCFGHQVVNSALGGVVEEVGTTAALVEAELDDDPVFEGVSPVVVSLHGDAVTELGEGLEVIASADHAQVFGTRHRSAPLWTVQFHPEIETEHREHLRETFDWDEREFTFEDPTPGRVFENFKRLVAESDRGGEVAGAAGAVETAE